MAEFDEKLIKITELKVLGELPDPFTSEDGTPVTEPTQWPSRRRELYRSAVELQYGTQPPAPERLAVEQLGDTWDIAYRYTAYRVTAGVGDGEISFTMRVFAPPTDGRHPAVVDGDLCFGYPFDKEFIHTFTDAGVMLVLFDRTELANDVRWEGRRRGPLYRLYPDYTFGALGAWAWGYSRCVDALEQLDIADGSCIAFTGHSRGGKTALLAGALDERAAIVNPNEACGAGCGCYRLEMKALTEDGEEAVSEKLDELIYYADHWFGPELKQYVDREAELPFDSHYLKALVAPRTLFVSEAAGDIPANPVGSWMTTEAAREVWRFLGQPDNVYWYYRRGYHYHKREDVQMLVNLILHKHAGQPLSDNFFRAPFTPPERIFRWRSPK